MGQSVWSVEVWPTKVSIVDQLENSCCNRWKQGIPSRKKARSKPKGICGVLSLRKLHQKEMCDVENDRGMGAAVASVPFREHELPEILHPL